MGTEECSVWVGDERVEQVEVLIEEIAQIHVVCYSIADLQIMQISVNKLPALHTKHRMQSAGCASVPAC